MSINWDRFSDLGDTSTNVVKNNPANESVMNNERGISRRNFIIGAAAVGLGAIVAGVGTTMNNMNTAFAKTVDEDIHDQLTNTSNPNYQSTGEFYSWHERVEDIAGKETYNGPDANAMIEAVHAEHPEMAKSEIARDILIDALEGSSTGGKPDLTLMSQHAVYIQRASEGQEDFGLLDGEVNGSFETIQSDGRTYHIDNGAKNLQERLLNNNTEREQILAQYVDFLKGADSIDIREITTLYDSFGFQVSDNADNNGLSIPITMESGDLDGKGHELVLVYGDKEYCYRLECFYQPNVTDVPGYPTPPTEETPPEEETPPLEEKDEAQSFNQNQNANQGASVEGNQPVTTNPTPENSNQSQNNGNEYEPNKPNKNTDPVTTEPIDETEYNVPHDNPAEDTSHGNVEK